MFILLTTVKRSNKKITGATPLSPNTFCFSMATIRTRLKVTFIFALPLLLSVAYFTNMLKFTDTSSRIQWSTHNVCNHYIHINNDSSRIMVLCYKYLHTKFHIPVNNVLLHIVIKER